MPIQDWMYGCPGRRSMTTLTGLHQFRRVSRKRKDEGKTECAVCGESPNSVISPEVWNWFLAAEEEMAELRGKRSW